MNDIIKIFQEISSDISIIKQKMDVLNRSLNGKNWLIAKKTNINIFDILEDINHILHVADNLTSIILKETEVSNEITNTN